MEEPEADPALEAQFSAVQCFNIIQNNRLAVGEAGNGKKQWFSRIVEMLTCASLHKRFTHCHFLMNSRSVWATFKVKKEIKTRQETSKMANYLSTFIISSGTKRCVKFVFTTCLIGLVWGGILLANFYRWIMILAKKQKQKKTFEPFVKSLTQEEKQFRSDLENGSPKHFFFSDLPFRLFFLNIFVVCWNAWKQFQTDNRFNKSAILQAV